jgi:hypothetical protein
VGKLPVALIIEMTSAKVCFSSWHICLLMMIETAGENHGSQ